MDAEVQRIEGQTQHHCTAEVTEGADGIHWGLAGGKPREEEWGWQENYGEDGVKQMGQHLKSTNVARPDSTISVFNHYSTIRR